MWPGKLQINEDPDTFLHSLISLCKTFKCAGLFINPLITIGSNFINCIWSWKEWIWECIISSDWIYYHRCNEQGVQKNSISRTCGFCWNVNVYDQLGNLFSCLAPALFIFVRCLQKGGKHTWDPGKVDRQYFIQTMSHPWNNGKSGPK